MFEVGPESSVKWLEIELKKCKERDFKHQETAWKEVIKCVGWGCQTFLTAIEELEEFGK